MVLNSVNEMHGFSGDAAVAAAAIITDAVRHEPRSASVAAAITGLGVTGLTVNPNPLSIRVL